MWAVSWVGYINMISWQEMTADSRVDEIMALYFVTWMFVRNNNIIIIIIISFMQGTYTRIPETNYVPREHGVAALLLFLFMVLISLLAVLNLLYFYISTFRSMCAVTNMAVFCSSLTSWFPGMLLTYFLNVFEIVPVAPIITGITFVFTFHMRCISVVRSLYFRIFSASFLNTFLSPKIATSIHTHVPIFNITDDNFWFVVVDSSVGLYLLIPQYGYLASLTCFY